MKHKMLVFIILTLSLMLTLAACQTTGNNPGVGSTSGSQVSGSATQSSVIGSSASISSSAGSASASTIATQPSKPTDSSNAVAGEHKASITPSEGWKKRDSLTDTRIQYVYADTEKAHNTLINLDIEENIFGRTEREFAQKRIESQKITLESGKPLFTDIADVSVGEYDALAYDVVTETGDLQKMFFIFEGSHVYIIQCSTMTEFWELVQDDFATMVESFTLG